MARSRFLRFALWIYLVSLSVANAQQCQVTAPDQLGPFFLPDQPIGDVICSGDREFPNQMKLYVRGRVFDEDCSTPLPNYKVEIWQADSEGVYHQPGRRCAITIYTGEQGEFQFLALPPAQYRFGIVRPRHIHFMVTGNGTCHDTLITQGYFNRNDTLGRQSCRTGCSRVDDSNIMKNIDVFDKTLPKSIRKCAGLISEEFNMVLRRRQSSSCSFGASKRVNWKGFSCPNVDCLSQKQCRKIEINSTLVSSVANFDYCMNIRILKKLSKCSFTAKVKKITTETTRLSELGIEAKVKLMVYLNRRDVCISKRKSYSICGMFADVTHKDISLSTDSSITPL